MKRYLETDVPVICVASGKGGVGKTSISLSIANELAKGARILVVDLDYFNRGVSGMLIDDSTVASEGAPFLLQQNVESPVLLVQSANKSNIFIAPCGEMDVAQMQSIERESPLGIRQRLAQLLQNLVNQHKIDVVLLDAHGGPDYLSFCAASLATKTILVSDPDKVTLHGTFNFLARLEDYLKETGAEDWPSLHLLFNRVSSAFSYQGLDKLYRESLLEWMDQPLLGVVPFQPDIFESFANAPFITDLFPSSLFARKIRLIVFKLFSGEFEHLLSAKIKKDAGRKRLEEMINQFQLFKPSRLIAAVGASFVLLFFTSLRQAIVGDEGVSDTLTQLRLSTSLGYIGLFASGCIAIGIWVKGMRASLRFSRNTFYGRLYRWKLWLNLSTLSVPAVALVFLLGSAFSSVRDASKERAILNNLRQLASASDQYFLEEGLLFTTYDALVGDDLYIRSLDPVAGEAYEYILLSTHQERLATITKKGKVIAYEDFGSYPQLHGDEATLFNLLLLEAAANTFFYAMAVDHVRYEELVGPESNKLIREIRPVYTEDYSELVIRKGVPLSISRYDGTSIELNPETRMIITQRLSHN
ncbi:MAG: AAA family ATPase [Verrucomicrobiota bacterium]